MKFTIAAASLLATLGAAQLEDIIAQIPQCALNCITQGINQSNCGLNDLECICSNYDAIARGVMPCLENESECESNQISGILDTTAQLCADSDGGNATSSVPTGSETVSPTGSETETVTSTEASTTVTETGSVTSSAPGESGTGDADGSDDGDGNAAGRLQAAGWAVAGAVAAAIAF